MNVLFMESRSPLPKKNYLTYTTTLASEIHHQAHTSLHTPPSSRLLTYTNRLTPFYTTRLTPPYINHQAHAPLHTPLSFSQLSSLHPYTTKFASTYIRLCIHHRSHLCMLFSKMSFIMFLTNITGLRHFFTAVHQILGKKENLGQIDY